MDKYSEFYWKRKELVRLRNIYKKRVERAKKAGLYNATYLSQISPQQLGFMEETKNTKPGEDMDLFSLQKFLDSSDRDKEQRIVQLDRKINKLADILNNPMTSLRGMKEVLKRDLKISKVDINSAMVRTRLERYEENPEGTYKHAKVQAIMDAIDANAQLTPDEKKKLKILIRERLGRRERVDYDDWILEWDVDINELLRDPKAFLDRLADGISEETLAELLHDTESVQGTVNPSEVGF